MTVVRSIPLSRFGNVPLSDTPDEIAKALDERFEDGVRTDTEIDGNGLVVRTAGEREGGRHRPVVAVGDVPRCPRSRRNDERGNR
jgi:hypothetical protein